MSVAPGPMTVDRVMARLVELEREHARLQREYARIGAQLLTEQAAWSRPGERVQASAPASSEEPGGKD